ncbi:MAG: hypothetical protein HZA81_02685 [Candidatus Taylorbacteria bacterium]|nr:hypothetical protein [Candidatus Taylorbacteria bacterium]
MNRNSWIAVVVIVILIVLGIFMFRSDDAAAPGEGDATSTPLSGTTTVRPYGQVTLKLGETAAFRGITFRPTSIIEDSRCPQDVQCIQAGTVRVNVESELDSGVTRQDAIGLNATSTIDTFRISLVRAEPATSAGKTIPNSDYRLTFEVRQGAVTDSELIGK